MVIGVHISGKNNSKSPLLNTLKIIAVKYPENHIIVFSETPITDLKKNFTSVSISPKPKNKLLLYYWYTYKLPLLLKKYNADVFIGDAGMLSLKTDVFQYLYFADNNFVPGDNRFFKKLFNRCLEKAKNIFTTEHFIKDDLVKKFAIQESKVGIVYHGLSIPLSAFSNETEHRTNPLSAPYDYYLYPVSIDSSAYLIILLKAFSQLKKRQKSSMKLVLLLQNVSEKGLIPSFENYRYRDDVVLIRHEENREGAIVAGAFACIWFCAPVDFEIIFTALQNNIPVIASDTKINTSLFGEGGIYSKISENDLTEKMQMLYKDESLKNKIIAEGKILLNKYDAGAAADTLYSTITQ